MRRSINKGNALALILLLAAALWMFSGSNQPDKPDVRSPEGTGGPMSVQVERRQPEIHQQQLNLSGRLQANRDVTLVAEIRARVIQLHVDKGQAVKAGQLLLELDQRDWPARVKQAEANLRQRRLEKQSAEKLQASGLANASQLAQVETALANAEAELTSARLQLEAARITAPFDGIINDRMVELGDFVRDGDPLFRLVDTDPYRVRAAVPENQIHQVSQNMPARARLLDGSEVSGQIRYLSTLADPASRTFAVELEVVNPDARPVPVGQSARLIIPLQARPAYFVSPALLAMDDDGNLGLKAVDRDNRVTFEPVEIDGAEQDGVWVYGPDSLDLITQGAGFVEPGETVMPVRTTSTASSGVAETQP